MEEEGGIATPLLHNRGGSTCEIDDVSNLEAISEGANSKAANEGITFMVAFSTIVAFCGSYIFGNATGYSAPVESQILNDLGLSLDEYSFFGSIITVGGLIGASCCGKLGDLLGRRGAMWVADAFCITGWLGIAFSEGAWSLDLGRLLVGVSCGIFNYLAPIYVAEIAPKSTRGAFIFVNAVLTSLGVTFTYSIGTVLNWRTLALIGTIPGLIQAVGMFFIPESPRWLVRLIHDCLGAGKDWPRKSVESCPRVA